MFKSVIVAKIQNLFTEEENDKSFHEHYSLKDQNLCIKNCRKYRVARAPSNKDYGMLSVAI